MKMMSVSLVQGLASFIVDCLNQTSPTTLHDAPPTTSTPGIFNNCNCFLPLRIIYSIVLKSARRTDDDSFRNCSRAYDVVVMEEYSSSCTCGRWCGDCIWKTSFFRSFRIDSRIMDRYRAKTSRCNPECLVIEQWKSLKCSECPTMTKGMPGRWLCPAKIAVIVVFSPLRRRKEGTLFGWRSPPAMGVLSMKTWRRLLSLTH